MPAYPDRARGLYRFKAREHICLPSDVALWDAGPGTTRYELMGGASFDMRKLNEDASLDGQLVVAYANRKTGRVQSILPVTETAYERGKALMSLDSLRDLATLTDDVTVIKQRPGHTLAFNGRAVSRGLYSLPYWHGWITARLEGTPYGDPLPSLRLYNARSRHRVATAQYDTGARSRVSNQSYAFMAGHSSYKENYA